MTEVELRRALLLERFGPVPLDEIPAVPPREVLRARSRPRRLRLTPTPPAPRDVAIRRLCGQGIPAWQVADRVGCSEAYVAKVMAKARPVRRGAA